MLVNANLLAPGGDVDRVPRPWCKSVALFVVDGSGTHCSDDRIVLVAERAQVAFRCLHLMLGELVDEFLRLFPG